MLSWEEFKEHPVWGTVWSLLLLVTFPIWVVVLFILCLIDAVIP